MLYHLVLFKIPASTPEEKIKNFYGGLETLSRINGVVSVQCGKADKAPYANYLDRTKGYTHALLVVLKNKKALEMYERDAYHNLIKSSIILPLIDMTQETPIMAVDFDGAIVERKSILTSPWTLAAVVTLFAGFAFIKLRGRFH